MKDRNERMIFPITRLHKNIKSITGFKRVAVNGAVYTGAVLQYLISEVLTLSVDISNGNFQIYFTKNGN